jgi:hypothetical protein
MLPPRKIAALPRRLSGFANENPARVWWSKGRVGRGLGNPQVLGHTKAYYEGSTQATHGRAKRFPSVLTGAGAF